MIVDFLKSKFGENGDFFIEKEFIGGKSYYLIGFKTLLDLHKTKLYIRKIIETELNTKKLLQKLSHQTDVDQDQIIDAVTQGKMVLISDDENHNAIVEPTPLNLDRSIDEPKNSNPIQGSTNAFVENSDVNIGLVRKRFNRNLQNKSYTVGKNKRKLSVLYIDGKAPKTLLGKLDTQLKKIDADIESLEDLEKHLEGTSWNPISKLFATEIPFETVNLLKKNRIVLFLDEYPFGLIYPHLIWDMFSVGNDRNFPSIITYLLRIIRFLGAIVTLLLPAIYVALGSVNPELIKINLALFIAQAREGIPFPVLVETLIMALLSDFILEAIVRLPKSVGPTVTMVGGIILGTAIVEAKLISNLLVIIISSIVISSSTVVGVQNSLYIRLLKYPVILLASIFGILGVYIGFVFICIYITSRTTNGIPYTAFKVK